jgi:hypothetical protein
VPKPDKNLSNFNLHLTNRKRKHNDLYKTSDKDEVDEIIEESEKIQDLQGRRQFLKINISKLRGKI